MAKRGPKPIKIKWKEFDKLCAMQCTLSEIAAWFECSEDTIERRVKKSKKMKFADYYAQKKEKGFVALRRLQWQKAKKGSNTMLIWLGKQWLDQRDKKDIEHSGYINDHEKVVVEEVVVNQQDEKG